MTPGVDTCPSDELLGQFVRGHLTGDELGAVTVHLDRCEACQRRVDQLPGLAALADDIRWAGTQVKQSSVDVSLPLAKLNELIPEYEFLAELGRGGMGIVYKARQRKLKRMVALKVLPALLGVVRPDAIARFRREAELAARLAHSNIIGVHDFGDVDGTLYYAMQLVEGRSLRDVLREINETGATSIVAEPPSSAAGTGGPSTSGSGSRTMIQFGSSAPPPRAYYRQVAKWMADVAEALQHAHGLGVIHRDIKPSNLLLGNGGRLLIADFGLALGAERESVTGSKTLIGTARYMSPEQVDASLGPVDARADVYGLGATMYELLAFRPMFAGSDDRDVLNQVLNREPTPPHKFIRQVPRELETICLKALEKDRKVRYPSAEEMADDLRRWSLDMPIHARRRTAIVRAGKFIKRRKLPVALGTTAAAFMLVSGVAFSAYRSADRSAESARSTILAQELELIQRDGEEKRDEGKLEEALDRTEAGLRIDPDSAELSLLKAKTLVSLERLQSACDTLDLLLARHPDNWRAHFLIARILGPRGCTPNLRIYDRPESQLRLSPDVRKRRYAHHRDELERLRPESEHLDVLRADEERDPQRAIVCLNGALQRDSQFIDALAARTRRYNETRNYRAMLFDAEQIIAKRPGWAPSHVDKGIALDGLKRYPESEQAYTAALQCDPTNVVAWNNRAVAKCNLGRFGEALADAEEAIRLDPKCADAYVVRSRGRRGLGQSVGAATDLNRAISLNSTEKEFYRERGNRQISDGHPDDALADFTRIIELDPKDAKAYCGRAEAYIAIKEYSRAIHDLTQAVSLEPSDANSYRWRRLAYARTEQFDAALSDCNRTVELDPGNAADYESRVVLCWVTQRYADAIDDLTRLIDLNSAGRGVYLMSRGMAYEIAGTALLAEADYAQAEEIDGPISDYARLWTYILRRLDGRSEAAYLILRQAPAGERSSWVDQLFRFFDGRLNETTLRAAAVTAGERCEAQYYIGVQALIDRRPDEARQAFDACLKLNCNGVTESDFARARLAQLAGTNSIERSENEQRNK